MGVTKDQPVYKLLHVGVPIARSSSIASVVSSDPPPCRGTLPRAIAVRDEAGRRLLDRTRALGIYDSSLIIVSSDHGTDLEPLG